MKRFMGPSAGTMLLLKTGLEEAIICLVVVFGLKLISKVFKKAFEGVVVVWRNLQRRQDAPEIGTVISIMEQRDIPAAAQRVEKLKQCAGPFGKFEAAQAFALHVASMATNHVPDVEFG